MKKFISLLFVFVLALSTIGCATTTNSSDEQEPKKGEYNIAYVNMDFFTEYDKEYEKSQTSLNPEYHGDFYQVQTQSSGYTSRSLQLTYFCHITDWEYGKNDTIILYLTDGRTLQTSSNNVTLVYDPDFK